MEEYFVDFTNWISKIFGFAKFVLKPHVSIVNSNLISSLVVICNPLNWILSGWIALKSWQEICEDGDQISC